MRNTHLAARNPPAGNSDVDDHIALMVVKARAAMGQYAAEIAAHGQARIDEAVTALAKSIYKPQNARRLAKIAVDVTGKVESKVVKNRRRTFGTLRDLLRVKSTDIIEQIPEKGIVKYAEPVGVVGAITPSAKSVGHAGQRGGHGAQGWHSGPSAGATTAPASPAASTPSAPASRTGPAGLGLGARQGQLC